MYIVIHTSYYLARIAYSVLIKGVSSFQVYIVIHTSYYLARIAYSVLIKGVSSFQVYIHMYVYQQWTFSGGQKMLMENLDTNGQLELN